MPHTPGHTPVESQEPTPAGSPVPDGATARESKRAQLITMFGFTPTITARCPASFQGPAHLHLVNPDNSAQEMIFLSDEDGLDQLWDLLPHADNRATALMALIQTINALQSLVTMQQNADDDQVSQDVLPQADSEAVASADDTPESQVSSEAEFANFLAALIFANQLEYASEEESDDDVEEVGYLKPNP